MQKPYILIMFYLYGLTNKVRFNEKRKKEVTNMKTLIDKTLLKDKIEFKGSIQDLKRKLNDSKGRGFDIDWISQNEFEFLSKWSIGTLHTTGITGIEDVARIKGFGSIKEKEDFIEIQLSTEPRVELYFILGIFLFIGFLSIFMKNEILSLIVYMSPLALILVWGILRIQEVFLFSKVKKHLKKN